MGTLFTKARKRLKEAAKYLDVHPDVIEKLKYPKETLAVSLIVRWRLYGASHALVIGIDNYTNGWPHLSNAVKDATLVAAELGRQGFEVKLLIDVTGAQLREDLRRFFAIKGDDPAARLFVWFAGQGRKTALGECLQIGLKVSGIVAVLDRIPEGHVEISSGSIKGSGRLSRNMDVSG